MKNFTYIIVSLLISFSAGAEEITGLQQKLEQRQKKITHLTDLGNRLMRTSTLMEFNKDNLLPNLKNATASLQLDSTVTRTKEYTDDWQYEWKEEFQYDSEAKNKLMISKQWDSETESLYIIDRSEMEFDNQGRMISMLTYSREEPSDELELFSKTEISYDASGRLKSVKYFSVGETTDWQFDMEQKYEYNPDGTLKESNTWLEEEGEVYNASKEIYTYNASGNPELSRMYYFMEGMEILFNEYRMTYDASGRLIEEEGWSVNFFTFELEKSSRTVTTYNAVSDVATDTYYRWDSTAEGWNAESKDEYVYGSTNFSEVVYPAYYSSYIATGATGSDLFHKIVNQIKTSSFDGTTWVFDEKTDYYYSSTGNSNVDPKQSEPVKIWPNPASETVKINWGVEYDDLLTLEIFRIDGTKVLEQITYSGKDIPISHLNRGIYIFRLLDERNTVYAGKLIKK
ncbi:MAG: T9SS type A sorting domain-containing protein [Mariniphaga sp.]|nr:T9SS type A sorting domain-containing protein [Mariniphaga sp.]MDD4425177.1 T9SS type A sorting domain-containing protein [Mariniphaga sp.]